MNAFYEASHFQTQINGAAGDWPNRIMIDVAGDDQELPNEAIVMIDARPRTTRRTQMVDEG